MVEGEASAPLIIFRAQNHGHVKLIAIVEVSCGGILGAQDRRPKIVLIIIDRIVV